MLLCFRPLSPLVELNSVFLDLSRAPHVGAATPTGLNIPGMESLSEYGGPRVLSRVRAWRWLVSPAILKKAAPGDQVDVND
jgi:hypothetical protein